MTFVRVARDQRGYETTYLLHAPHPGERPRVLYCYRTAPDVRVGRPAFDRQAIRELEEHHPEIVFDWSQLIAEASVVAPEAERRPEWRRKPPRARQSAPKATEPPDDPPLSSAPPVDEVDVDPEPMRLPAQAADSVDEPANPLLDELVGREIAARLRRQHRVLSTRIGELGDATRRTALQAQLSALDPERWSTPEAVLEGVQNAVQRFEELLRLVQE